MSHMWSESSCSDNMTRDAHRGSQKHWIHKLYVSALRSEVTLFLDSNFTHTIIACHSSGSTQINCTVQRIVLILTSNTSQAQSVLCLFSTSTLGHTKSSRAMDLLQSRTEPAAFNWISLVSLFLFVLSNICCVLLIPRVHFQLFRYCCWKKLLYYFLVMGD